MRKNFKILISIILIVLVGYFIFSGGLFKTTKEETNVKEEDSQKDSITDYQLIDLEQGEMSLKAVIYKVDNPQNLFLFDNFKENLSSLEIKEKEKCNFLINAGFYSEDNLPIGLIKSEGKTISNYQENKTFNGFFSIDGKGKVFIGTQFPDEEVKLAFQSGPLLIVEGNLKKLKLEKDKLARRMVAAKDEDNLYFISIYDPESFYQGANLVDLPQLLKAVEEKLNLTFKDAINLDGGVASTFAVDDFGLTELTFVGTFLCLKD